MLDGKRLITQGQRAHIRSDIPGGPRHEPGYPDADRYENLLLLCRCHHHLIDSQPVKYPVELLEEWKRRHEGSGYVPGPVLVPPSPESFRYVRRTEVYAVLTETLNEHGWVALTGLSGAGKTQLAADLFRSQVDEYSLRLWIRSRDPESRAEDYARAGLLLGVQRHDDEAVGDYCARIREALEASPGWLVVFDDAPDDGSIHPLIPRVGGHVVVTSQAQAWPTAKLRLQALARSESIELLTQHPNLATVNPAILERLAEAGGDLPLCLVQLMGYLDATGMDAEDLIALFVDRRITLLERGAPPDHLPIRVSVSNAIDALGVEARSLLETLSVLAPVPIPVPATIDPIEGDDLLGPLADRVALEDAIADLRRYSLIDREGDQMACHEITQLLTRQALSEDDLERATYAALAVVATLLPPEVDREDHLPTALALLPHANAVVERIQVYAGFGPFAAAIVNRLAPAYQMMGEGDRAEAELRRALALLDEDGSEDFGLRGSILHNLSNSAADRGDYRPAIDLAREALEYKATGGEPAESRARTMGALGCHLEALDQLDEALELHLGAVQLLEPPTRPRGIADALNDTARVERRLGRHDDAVARSERAIAIASQDPDAWSELAEANLNLALLAEEQGDARALQFADAAVKACESSGTASVMLAKGLGSRGRLRTRQGDLRGVADIQTAISLYEQFEGVQNNYATALGNLGSALIMLGRSAGDAKVMADGLSALRESLEILRCRLPSGHATVLTAENMLRQGRETVWGH